MSELRRHLLLPKSEQTVVVVSPAVQRAGINDFVQKICQGDRLVIPQIPHTLYYDRSTSHPEKVAPVPQEVSGRQAWWVPTREEENLAVKIKMKLPGSRSVAHPTRFEQQSLLLAMTLSRHPWALLVDNSPTLVVWSGILGLGAATPWGLFLHGVLRNRVTPRDCWDVVSGLDTSSRRTLGKPPFKGNSFESFTRWIEREARKHHQLDTLPPHQSPTVSPVSSPANEKLSEGSRHTPGSSCRPPRPGSTPTPRDVWGRSPQGRQPQFVR